MREIIVLLALLDLAGSIALLILCYFFAKAYKLTKNKLILYFFMGFAILCAGELTHSFISLSLLAVKPRRIIASLVLTTANMVLLFSETLAYLLIAVGYSMTLKREEYFSKTLVFSPVPFLLRISGEVFPIFVLLYVILNAATVYMSKRSRSSLLILIAFIFLLFDHVLTFFSLLLFAEVLFILARLCHFAAIVSLFAMILEVMRSEKREEISR